MFYLTFDVVQSAITNQNVIYHMSLRGCVIVCMGDKHSFLIGLVQ